MEAAEQTTAQTTPRPALKRSLGLGLITLYGLGNILGAGIYVLVGKVAGAAGVYAPLAFIIAALVAALTAFTYGELAARHPVSAGEAVYVDAAFALRILSVLVGVLIAAAGMVSAAALARGFVGYLHVFVDAPGWLVLVLFVAILGGIAAWGIGESARVAALLTLVEAGGLLLIIAVAGESFAGLPVRAVEFFTPSSAVAWQGVMLGAFLAFYAFIGFEDMVNVAEEVKRPERNLPLGIIIALAVSTVLYLLVVLVALLSVPVEMLKESDAPLAVVYTQVTGRQPVLISIIGLLAVINGALIQMIMASRIFYGMSAKGWLPGFVGRINPKTQTPVVATGLVSALVLVLALWVPLVGLAGATSALVLVVFALVSMALIRLKRRDPRPAGISTIPMWVPVAGVVASLALLAAQTRLFW
jgi:amino acid transporter